MLQCLNLNGVTASVTEAVMLQCSGMKDFWAYTWVSGPCSPGPGSAPGLDEPYLRTHPPAPLHPVTSLQFPFTAHRACPPAATARTLPTRRCHVDTARRYSPLRAISRTLAPCGCRPPPCGCHLSLPRLLGGGVPIYSTPAADVGLGLLVSPHQPPVPVSLHTACSCQSPPHRPCPAAVTVATASTAGLTHWPQPIVLMSSASPFLDDVSFSVEEWHSTVV
jgi:hypothetical protein